MLGLGLGLGLGLVRVRVSSQLFSSFVLYVIQCARKRTWLGSRCG